jgi:hypothetical protein
MRAKLRKTPQNTKPASRMLLTVPPRTSDEAQGLP